MSVSFKPLKQRGDTIVEVLIAIAVASMVLGLSYGTMNRNLGVIRATQERTQASKYAQGQLEQLKAYVSNSGTFSSSRFCMSGGSPVYAVSGGSPDGYNLSGDDFSHYTGACQQEGIYSIGLHANGGGVYRIYVRWDRIASGERDEIVMVYKVQ